MTSFFGVPRASVTWEGALTDVYSSQGRVRRQFCSACGSHMTYQFEGWPDETHLYAATLDDPAWFEPQAHYHYAEKLPWITVIDDLPKHAHSAEDSQ